MADIFISYARSTAARAHAVAEGLRALGYGVWRDDEIPAHRAYADVIQERLTAAKAVVVVWSAEAAKSEWVRSEAEQAREARKLVQLTVDGARLPMPFDQIQCVDLADWSGEAGAPGWRKVAASVAELVKGARTAAPDAESPASRKLSICVLPFANISDDPQQEYFSDGITEDIITDLSKVSALSVVSRNTAFSFKGKSLDLRQVARQLDVGHVLEGSVRKAGARVRITAQLIEGSKDSHIWAERYDHDLTDIFALQDEISQAIVAALKLKLLPEEKQAIERRGTDNVDAYNLYLMARQLLVRAYGGAAQAFEASVRLCRRVTEIDPNYARAWALMAQAQTELRFAFAGAEEEEGIVAAERALSLDPTLAEPHAIRAHHLAELGRRDEADAELEVALSADPESYEVNVLAGRVRFGQGRFEDAIRHYEKITALSATDVGSAGMLVTCYSAVGDVAGARRAAKITLERAEKALAQDPSNGRAFSFGVNALAMLGEAERARDWTQRALLIDPDNQQMLYNLACSLSAHLGDIDQPLELLGPFFAKTSMTFVRHAKVDPDLDPLRGDGRFQAMLAAAEARLTSGLPT
jgi:adenylate cyclase